MISTHMVLCDSGVVLVIHGKYTVQHRVVPGNSFLPRVLRRDMVHLVSDHARTSSISSLIPQVGLEATASVAQGAEGAVCLETVDGYQHGALFLFNTLCLMAIIRGTISNGHGGIKRSCKVL